MGILLWGCGENARKLIEIQNIIISATLSYSIKNTTFIVSSSGTANLAECPNSGWADDGCLFQEFQQDCCSVWQAIYGGDWIRGGTGAYLHTHINSNNHNCSIRCGFEMNNIWSITPWIIIDKNQLFSSHRFVGDAVIDNCPNGSSFTCTELNYYNYDITVAVYGKHL